jgi:SAM-dependent methyltransferase
MMHQDGTQDLQRIYRTRFEGKWGYRVKVWKILTRYFARWVPPLGAVLDLGAGYCEFINNITAARKHAMDLNPETLNLAGPDVKIFQQDCSEPWPLAEAELDAVFTSNFLEHLPNKEAVRRTLSNAYYCLKPGGRFIAIGPNIKYTQGAYWDFFDHYVELTELSLSEALSNCGFDIEKQLPRFLPYTMSQGRQYPTWMLRLYLALPAAWPLFGKQFLVIGIKPKSNTGAASNTPLSADVEQLERAGLGRPK